MKLKAAKKDTNGIPHYDGFPEAGGGASKVMMQLYPHVMNWMVTKVLDGEILYFAPPWHIGVMQTSANLAKSALADCIEKGISQLDFNDVPIAIAPLRWAVPVPPRQGRSYCRPSVREAEAFHSGPVRVIELLPRRPPVGRAGVMGGSTTLVTSIGQLGATPPLHLHLATFFQALRGAVTRPGRPTVVGWLINTVMLAELPQATTVAFKLQCLYRVLIMF